MGMLLVIQHQRIVLAHGPVTVHYPDVPSGSRPVGVLELIIAIVIVADMSMVIGVQGQRDRAHHGVLLYGTDVPGTSGPTRVSQVSP